MSDLYEDLNVPHDATSAQIKAAGRRLQKKTHPDAGGDQEAFVKVQNALKVLLDPDRRAEYDRTGNSDARNPRDMEAAEANALLAQVMNQVMGAGNPARLDLPAAILNVIAGLKGDATHEAQAQKEAGERKIETLKSYMERLKKPKGGDDRVRSILEAQHADITRAMVQRQAEMERRHRICDMAQAMSEGYEYRVDPVPVQTQNIYGAGDNGPGSWGNAATQDLLARELEKLIREGRFR